MTARQFWVSLLEIFQDVAAQLILAGGAAMLVGLSLFMFAEWSVAWAFSGAALMVAFWLAALVVMLREA